MLEHDLSLTHSGSDSVPALHEVCRSILNPGSLSFVAANAPWEVVHAFETRQQRLASTMLFRQLRKTEGSNLDRSLWLFLQSVPLRMKHAILLVACVLGRLGLG